MDPATEEMTEGESAERRMVARNRLGLVLTVALLVIVVGSLPFAVRSMVGQLFGTQRSPLYDVTTGMVVSPDLVVTDPAHANYFNIAVVDVSEARSTATLAISGNRTCLEACPEVTVTLFSVDDNPSLRRGLPPSAAITLNEDDLVFSESVELPVLGRPNLYPFDTYDLWLGFSVSATDADGNALDFDRERVRRGFVITLQNQDSGLVMAPPRKIDPATVAAPTDPGMLPMVEALAFSRPAYVKMLAVLLVVLISVSGGIALATRSIGDLVLGVGGLILGVWGIRSVLVNQPLPGVSAVDIALSLVILFLLLGLAFRLALHFFQRSDLKRTAAR